MKMPSSSQPLIASQYFVYFGVMGIFLPYFNLYCYHLGFSGFQIGVLSAVRSVVMIVMPLVWGLAADRFGMRRPLYIVCNFISAACWALFLLTTEFFPMLLITIGYALFYAPLISFLEAFAMDVLGRRKRHYGRMRAWGSVAFILMVSLAGRLIDLYSVRLIVALILAGSWLQAAMSLGIPRVPGSASALPGSGLRQLFNRQVVVFLSSAFLMLLSHGAYYAFFSIHLANLGFGSTFIGGCWALASSAEIVTMLLSARIFARFSFQTVILVSFATAVLRWAGLWQVRSAAAIVALQLTHAVTYGTFHMASILYMDTLAPAAAKTLGQAVNNATTYGLGLMMGFLLSGALYEKLGSFALFAVSAAIALTGGVIFARYAVWRGPAQKSG